MWITNVKIWDGESDSLSGEDAVLVEEGRIVRLASSDEADADASNLNGLYLIPGLIDAHIHLCLDPEIKNPLDHTKMGETALLSQMQARALEMLRAGITSARDLGGGQWLELTIRDRINRGEIQGTRLVCAGQPITSVGGHCYFWGGEAADFEAAAVVMQRQIEHKVDLIKVMATGGSITPNSKPADSQYDGETMAEIVALANEAGFDVAAHCHGTDGIKNAAEAGVATIEHCSWVGEDGWGRHYDPEVADTISKKGVWVSPTVNAGWRRYIGTNKFETMMKENYTKLRAAGVRMIASTDAGIPNVFHKDLPKAIPVFAHFAGFTNVEALRSATSDCATAIGLGDVVGRVAPGFEADFVFLDSNPLDDLDALVDPVRVMSRGRFVEAEPS